jgi:hypothetical protein
LPCSITARNIASWRCVSIGAWGAAACAGERGEDVTVWAGWGIV